MEENDRPTVIDVARDPAQMLSPVDNRTEIKQGD
jgi:hypothetical protein